MLKSFMFLECNVLRDLTSSLSNSLCNEVSKMSAQYMHDHINQRKISRDLNEISSQFLAGKQTYMDMIFDGAAKEEIQDIDTMVDRIIEGVKSRAPLKDFLTVLLSGPPGGGKTEIMRHICAKARSSYGNVMTFIFPGSYLRRYKNREAVAAIEDMMRSVEEAVVKGAVVVMCIDEADALLSSNSGNKNSRSDILVSFLSHISHLESLVRDPKTKGNCIVLCTTNVVRALNEAMSRRFTFFVELGIPQKSTLTAIFKSKILKFAIECSKNLKLPIKYWPSVISDNYINVMIQNSHGLMGGEINNIVQRAFIRARLLNIPLDNRTLFYCFMVELKKRLIIVHKFSDEVVSEIMEKMQEIYNKIPAQEPRSVIKKVDTVPSSAKIDNKPITSKAQER